MVADYGMTQEDAEVVVVLGCLTHCLGMAIHRANHEEMSLFLAADRLPGLLEGLYEEPERTIVTAEVLQTIITIAPTASRCRSRPASCAWPTRWTWPRAARGSRSRPAACRSTRCRRPPSRRS